MQWITKNRGCLIGVGSVLLLLPFRALSQQNAPAPPPDLANRPVKLSLKAQGFDDAIATLSKTLGLNILADDESLPQAVTLNIDGSAKDALDQVSDAFDYRWKQKPSGIIVMYKRFHRPAEHPQYNLPELRSMAHSVTAIYRSAPVKPNDDFTACSYRFFGLLTPLQVETLRAGKMLHGSDLNANQSEAFQTVILRNMLFDQIQPWQEMEQELDSLENSFFQVKASPAAFLYPAGHVPDAARSREYLSLTFGLKVGSETVFSQYISSMQSEIRPTEAKKP